MVKFVCALLLAMALAAPAFAQDDYPQVEIALGYGNLGLKDLVPDRHSGFATHQAFNLNSVLGIENYVGYYGLGTFPGTGKVQLITDMFGAKANYRAAGPVLYGAVAIGGGWLRFPDLGVGSNNALAWRWGGGVDVPLGDSFAWKVDVSRMSFHFSDSISSWKFGVNVSTGIVIKIQY